MTGLVVLDRLTVERWLTREESVAASCAADMRLREELRRGLQMSAAAQVGALLPAPDTPTGPRTSATSLPAVDGRPFGDELTTEQAAERLGVGARQVRRRCRFPAGHPDRLRSRRSRGKLVVSGADVDACSSGS